MASLIPPITKPISDLPLHFALILFPKFQALDVFGPLDALNTLKRLYPSLPLQLSILSSTLSPVSTSDETTTSPPFEQKIVPTHTFTSPPTTPIHILFIPGGIGTGPASKHTWLPAVTYLTQFLSNPTNVQHLKGIFTVCTGSVLLARSQIRDISSVGGEGSGLKGILDGILATTNKRNFERARTEFPNVLWQAQARWVTTTLPLPLTTTSTHPVQLWTTSGVSAGLDGIFALISDCYGPPVANFIAQGLEYNRVTDPTNDPFAVN